MSMLEALQGPDKSRLAGMIAPPKVRAASRGDTLPNEDDDDYLPVQRLRTQYYDFLTTKRPEIEEQQDARRYYHGAQWSAEDIKILKARRQPVITFNRIVRKINGIIGLMERQRAEPKAYPRAPRDEEGAEVATITVRTVLDSNEWRARDPECVKRAAIEGIAGVELRLIEGDQGDPDIEFAEVHGEDFFYDPRSMRYDFSDARYMGVAKWVDEDAAIEMFPEQEEEITALIDHGTDLTTGSDQETKWILSSERRVRLVEHWYMYRGKWRWAFYIGLTLMAQGESPFINEKRKTIARFVMFSAAVDQDGDRYGFVRNLKGPQDEVNQRRSKALWTSNSRRVIADKGAVDDVEKARREWARPDGFIEKNRGAEFTPDNTSQDLENQFRFLGDAKDEIEQFANVSFANMSQGALTNLSGRAISLLQQPGMAELGPFILAHRGWKLRLYRAIWAMAQQHWQAERWLRLLDEDEEGGKPIAKFIQVNGLDLDQYGRPMLVNALGAIDVNILMDEGPDVVSMLQDTWDVLRNQPAGTVPPQVLIELAPIPGSEKRKIMKLMQPPPPNPVDIAAKQIALKTAETEIHRREAETIGKRAKAVSDIASAAEHASKAGLNALQMEQFGVMSAPIGPEGGMPQGASGDTSMMQGAPGGPGMPPPSLPDAGGGLPGMIAPATHQGPRLLPNGGLQVPDPLRPGRYDNVG